MLDEVPALRWRKQRQRDRDELDDLVEATRSRSTQERFQFGEGLFNRIEVWAVGREKAEGRAGRLNRRPNSWVLVDRQVVEHDDIAASQGGDQDLIGIRTERVGIDRAIEHRRGGEAFEP